MDPSLKARLQKEYGLERTRRVKTKKGGSWGTRRQVIGNGLLRFKVGFCYREVLKTQGRTISNKGGEVSFFIPR
jgi:hypothetical protein